MVNVDDRLTIISRHTLFRNLRRATREEIAQKATTRQYDSGSLIFHKGDLGNALVLVMRGLVRISITSADGREFILQIAGPGELVGEVALTGGALQNTDCIAEVKTDALRIGRQSLNAAAADEPAFDRAARTLLLARLQSTLDTVDALAFCSLQERLARILLKLNAIEHFADDGRLTIASQEKLSMMVNATRPKVSKHLQIFKKAGAISIATGQITVLDANILKRYA